jgi:Asp-tRNA(Asn)/Glu-tRNA(Gln) amidotransferase B subunit
VGWAGERDVDPADTPLTGSDLAELVSLTRDGTLSKKLGREVLADVLAGAGSPATIVAERGLEQLSDADELARICDAAIADNAAAAEQVREGNTKAIGALVGAVMRATQGKANPQLVNELLRERLMGGA